MGLIVEHQLVQTRCGVCMVQAIELHIRQQQPHKGAPAPGGGLRIRILRGFSSWFSRAPAILLASP